MSPKVSVIVINWNGLDLTRNCLKFLKRNTYYRNVEFIVIDNGSTDGSYETLKREFPWSKHIRLFPNKGYSNGANAGIGHAKGKYILLMNNDVQVTKGWLKTIVKVLDSNKNIASATPKILSYGETYKKSSTYKEVVAPSGAITCYRKTALDEIGLLDEKNFSPIYGEENDWSYRAANAGYKLVDVCDSVVYHTGSVTTKREYESDKLYIVREAHRLKAMLFNLPLLKLIGFIPGLSLIFLRSILDGKTYLLLRAYFNLIKNMDTIIKERRRRLNKVKR